MVSDTSVPSPGAGRRWVLKTNVDLFGGGVLADAGDLTLTNCAFQDNTAGDGAAGTPDGGFGGFGGGLAFLGTNISIDGCSFQDNHAGDGGDGIDSPAASGRGGNGGPGGFAGAIAFQSNGTTTIRNSSFVGNSSGAGGDAGRSIPG